MSRSVIYTSNTSEQTVSDGGVISPGTIIRRYGCNCQLNGNAFLLNGTGYYTISANVTFSPTETGTYSLKVQQDGKDISGAVTSTTIVTAETGSSVSLNLSDIVARVFCCMDSTSNITIVLSGGAATIINFSASIHKD